MDVGAEDEAVGTGFGLGGHVARAARTVGLTLVAGGGDRPAGQGARQFSDIGLGVAPVSADRVQLHHLAGQVFIQTGVAARAGHAVGTDRAGLIQIQKHGRMLFGCQDQILEPAEDVGADGLALVLTDEGAAGELGGRDRQGVRPEQGPALGEAVVGGRAELGASQELLRRVLGDVAAGGLTGFAPGDGLRIGGVRHGWRGSGRGVGRRRSGGASVAANEAGVALIVDILGDAFGGVGELAGRLGRALGPNLAHGPAARIGGDAVDLARPGAQT